MLCLLWSWSCRSISSFQEGKKGGDNSSQAGTRWKFHDPDKRTMSLKYIRNIFNGLFKSFDMLCLWISITPGPSIVLFVPGSWVGWQLTWRVIEFNTADLASTVLLQGFEHGLLHILPQKSSFTLEKLSRLAVSKKRVGQLGCSTSTGEIEALRSYHVTWRFYRMMGTGQMMYLSSWW